MSVLKKKKVNVAESLPDSVQKFPESTEGIDILNNDCLMHIMEYLSIADCVRIERVSRRWNSVSRTTWRRFKHLSFHKDCWGLRRFNVNHNILQKILYRGGQFLISLDLSKESCRKTNIKSVMGPDILKDVAKYCPNIQHLDITHFYLLSIEGLKALSKKCFKLTFLAVPNITDTTDSYKRELSLLFQKNTNLKVLEVGLFSKVLGECLKDLNSQSIESISVSSDRIKDICYEDFPVWRNFRNLKQLRYKGLYVLHSDNFMTDIASNCGSLIHLSLIVMQLHGTYGVIDLLPIAQLKNLETLQLRNMSRNVYDELLALIGTNCKLLKLVDISFCYSITNNGLANIVTLPDLEVLEIAGLYRINSQLFDDVPMPSLRRLNCIGCGVIQDEGIAKLIETSGNLQYLNLRNCKKITNELLKIAIRSTKKRNNNIILNLCLIHTSVQQSMVHNNSPFLHVVNMDEYENFICITEEFNKFSFYNSR